MKLYSGFAVILATWLTPVLVPPVAGAAPTTQPDQWLAASVASMKFPASYICHLETEERYGNPLNNIDGDTIESTIRCDGARYDFYVLKSRIFGVTTKPYQASRSIWDGKQFVIRTDNPRIPGPPSVSVTSDPLIVDRLGLAASRLDIDGCYRTRAIAALLRDSGKARLVGEEAIRGDVCVLIEGKTPNGYLKVWLDRNKGLRCAKAMVHLGAGDMVGDREDKLPDKRSLIAEIDVTIEDISFRTFGTFLLPESGTITETTHFSDGRREFRLVTTEKRTKLEINPRFEGGKAFVMDGIPNGTPVNIHYNGARMDDPFIYVWRDGQIVKDDDATATDRIDKSLANEPGARD